MLNYVLRLTYLCKIKMKDEEWQQKLKTFKEISQKIEKKINDQKLVQQSWFPSRKALKNYTKSFEIKIINNNDPVGSLRYLKRLR